MSFCAFRPTACRLPTTTLRLSLRQISTSRPSYDLRFSLGVGYANKTTPPFSSPAEADQSALKGFQPNTKIGRWKRDMLAHGGGRQELFDTKRESREDDWEQVDPKGVNDRRRWGSGEDSFFVNDEGNNKAYLAVTDGVGGWAESGIDPSLFSESLSYYMHQHTLKNPSAEPGVVLKRGYDAVVGDREVKMGSSTAVVVGLDKRKGLLQAVNLGDSGFSIIRDQSMHHQTKPQTYSFNFPWQLSKLPSSMKTQGAVQNTPEQADTFELELKKGDMVVLYTDGFSDNVHPEQMLALLKHVDKTLSSPENAFLDPVEREIERSKLFADVLVAYARLVMGRPDVQTPFEVEAARNGLKWPGGKIDDIAVLTAHVGED